MSSAILTKRENIHFRLSAEIKETIDKAIAVSGQSLTEFATNALLTSATEVLEREYTTSLSSRDRNTLLALLDAESEPNEGLSEAAQIHKKLITE